MRESHEKVMVFAVCEDKTIYLWGKFSEDAVGDDIYGNYQIGLESGAYCFTPEKAEVNGSVSAIPDPIALQEYLIQNKHQEFDAISEAVGISEKIKAFYWLESDLCDEATQVVFTKITEDAIKSLHDAPEASIMAIAPFLRMTLLGLDKIQFDGSDEAFENLIRA